jgi:hypothetical protein
LIEEVVVGKIHGSNGLGLNFRNGGRDVPSDRRDNLIIFVILVPYFAFRSLGDIVGDEMLVRLFFERHQST